MKIDILVATMTGTAQLVAQEIELSCADDHTAIAVTLMDGLGPEALGPAEERIVLVCSSTYGQGDIPDNGKPLFDALAAQRPDLSHLRFGVLGLGDRTYKDTFNAAGARWEALLLELGARRIGERAALDAASGELPEDTAVEWMRGWVELARTERVAAAG